MYEQFTHVYAGDRQARYTEQAHNHAVRMVIRTRRRRLADAADLPVAGRFVLDIRDRVMAAVGHAGDGVMAAVDQVAVGAGEAAEAVGQLAGEAVEAVGQLAADAVEAVEQLADDASATEAPQPLGAEAAN